MGPTGGLNGSEIPKQVHCAVRALCGRRPAEYSHKTIYLTTGIFTLSMNLLLTNVFFACFSVELTVQIVTDALSSLLGD